MLEDRRLSVLRAIVEDFVQTNEPVGSKALVERHQLGVSSATIRNDMAALEDEGLIAQPHTSAGRIPTDAGYRVFVDRLSTLKPMSPAERRAIESFLEGAVDLDDVMQRSVRLLAQLTRQVAFVQYPTLSRSTVRHVEFVPMTATRLLLIVIASTGRIEQRVVDLPDALSESVLSDLRTNINALISGVRLSDVPGVLADLPARFDAEVRPSASAVVATLLDSLVERTDDRVVLGGTANIGRLATDFQRDVQPVLEALEEHVVLLNLLGEVASTDNIQVRIGHENAVENFTRTSVVTTGYGHGTDPVAALGILGPTRMDYPATMAAVRAVARYLGRIIAENG